MAEIATVTIPVDEYFDLRSKAETNLYLTTRLAETETALRDIDRRLWEFEKKLLKQEG